MTRLSRGVAVRSFTSPSGNTERYLTVEAPGTLDLRQQLEVINERYAKVMQDLQLTPESAVFRRLYVSDAINQFKIVRQSSLYRSSNNNPVAVSLIEQPPLPNGKVAMLAYHLESPNGLIKRNLLRSHVMIERGALRHLWTTGLCTANDSHASTASSQTTEIFEGLAAELAAADATLADNCMRTWIYVKNVDVFYEEMVAARQAVFERYGLTKHTHFIASTGIEGACGDRYDVVSIDAYSILGLARQQVSYLRAYDRLCDPKDYNVGFERGTRIDYADRTHLLISGTASINPSGEVVHVGDIGRQLEYALENIEGLLRSANAHLDDMTHFLVYVRDPSDYPRVAGYFAERFPETPRLVLRAPVCRPEWLVEIEGIAVIPNDAPNLPSF